MKGYQVRLKYLKTGVFRDPKYTLEQLLEAALCIIKKTKLTQNGMLDVLKLTVRRLEIFRDFSC